MNVLKSLMNDKHFRSRARAYANGKFVDEHHVWHCAMSLGRDIAQTYGAVTMLLPGHVIAAAFQEEDGYLVVGRGPIPEAPEGVFEAECASLGGNGYMVRYKGKIDAVNSVMARISADAATEQQAQDTPLLH